MIVLLFRLLLILALCGPTSVVHASRKPDRAKIARFQKNYTTAMNEIKQLRTVKLKKGIQRPLDKKRKYEKEWNDARDDAEKAAKQIARYGGPRMNVVIEPWNVISQNVQWVGPEEDIKRNHARMKKIQDAMAAERKKWTSRPQASSETADFKKTWESASAKVLRYAKKIQRDMATLKRPYTVPTITPWAEVSRSIQWLTPQELAAKHISNARKLVAKLRSAKEYTKDMEARIKKAYRREYEAVLKLGARPGDLPKPDNVDRIKPALIDRHEAVNKYLRKMEQYEKEVNPTSARTMLRADFDAKNASYRKAHKKAVENMRLYDNLINRKALYGDWKTRLKNPQLKPGPNLTLTDSKNARDEAEIKRTEAKLNKYLNELKKDNEYTIEEQNILLSKYTKARAEHVKAFPRTASTFPEASTVKKGTAESSTAKTERLIKDLEHAQSKLESGTLDERSIDRFTKQYIASRKSLARIDGSLARRFPKDPPRGARTISDRRRINELLKRIEHINDALRKGVTKEEVPNAQRSYSNITKKLEDLLTDVPAQRRPNIPGLAKPNILDADEAVDNYRKQITAIDKEIGKMNLAERGLSASKDTAGFEGQLSSLLSRREKLVRRIRALDRDAARKLPEPPEAGANRKKVSHYFKDSSRIKAKEEKKKLQGELEDVKKQRAAMRKKMLEDGADTKAIRKAMDELDEEETRLKADIAVKNRQTKNWFEQHREERNERKAIEKAEKTAHDRQVELALAQQGIVKGQGGQGPNISAGALPAGGMGIGAPMAGGMGMAGGMAMQQPMMQQPTMSQPAPLPAVAPLPTVEPLPSVTADTPNDPIPDEAPAFDEAAYRAQEDIDSLTSFLEDQEEALDDAADAADEFDDQQDAWSDAWSDEQDELDEQRGKAAAQQITDDLDDLWDVPDDDTTSVAPTGGDDDRGLDDFELEDTWNDDDTGRDDSNETIDLGLDDIISGHASSPDSHHSEFDDSGFNDPIEDAWGAEDAVW